MGEVTDYRGQERTVESITVGVRHRADLVEDLYRAPRPAHVISIDD